MGTGSNVFTAKVGQQSTLKSVVSRGRVTDGSRAGGGAARGVRAGARGAG